MERLCGIEIGDLLYYVQILTTEEDKEKGLQNVENLPKQEGALFDYSKDPQKELSFWMKDTSIPLDIIFINDDNEVVAVEQGVPYSEELITCIADGDEKLAYVLEVNVESGIQIGDDFDFINENDDPEMYLLGKDGNPVYEIKSGTRIFSRIHTRELIRLAKKAKKSKSDKDYKKLGKKMFRIISIQDHQEAEYVEAPKDQSDE